MNREMNDVHVLVLVLVLTVLVAIAACQCGQFLNVASDTKPKCSREVNTKRYPDVDPSCFQATIECEAGTIALQCERSKYDSHMIRTRLLISLCSS
jgi:hypothetical protein